MTLTYTTTTIDIGPPLWSIPINDEIVQGSIDSAEGVEHVQDFGVYLGDVSYTFSNMPKARFILLRNFFYSIAIARLNTITIDDELNPVYTGRFLDTNLGFKLDRPGILASGGFTIKRTPSNTAPVL